MKVQDMMRGYDYGLPLYDVLNNSGINENGDPEISTDRRVLAGATIGIGLDVAYFAITEMQEAFTALASETSSGMSRSEGYRGLEEILCDKNPFQMRLWYLLYDTPIERAITELSWLQSLTYRRGRMCIVVREHKLPVTYATNAQLCESLTAAQLMGNVMTGD
ncbi:MAG: hypothetical protein EOO77_17745 [Oxalobacteraceae bacterium]|nr:MAG: hypothetical protein EOO77_17745 [Oxalobacteraceae bacterium]